MINKILGFIGVVWGGMIVFNVVTRLMDGTSGSGSFMLGTIIAGVIGVVMFVAGVKALRSKPTSEGTSEVVEPDISDEPP